MHITVSRKSAAVSVASGLSLPEVALPLFNEIFKSALATAQRRSLYHYKFSENTLPQLELILAVLSKPQDEKLIAKLAESAILPADILPEHFLNDLISAAQDRLAAYLLNGTTNKNEVRQKMGQLKQVWDSYLAVADAEKTDFTTSFYNIANQKQLAEFVGQCQTEIEADLAKHAKKMGMRFGTLPIGNGRLGNQVVEGTGLIESPEQRNPFLRRAAIFIAGSMGLGALLAHYRTETQQIAVAEPKPVPAAVAKPFAKQEILPKPELREPVEAPISLVQAQPAISVKMIEPKISVPVSVPVMAKIITAPTPIGVMVALSEDGKLTLSDKNGIYAEGTGRTKEFNPSEAVTFIVKQLKLNPSKDKVDALFEVLDKLMENPDISKSVKEQIKASVLELMNPEKTEAKTR